MRNKSPELEHVDVVADAEHERHVVVDQEPGEAFVDERAQLCVQLLALGGSRPAVGSSRHRTVGRPATARATPTSLRCPWDCSAGQFSSSTHPTVPWLRNSPPITAPVTLVMPPRVANANKDTDAKVASSRYPTCGV
jgi:hypothetical protein